MGIDDPDLRRLVESQSTMALATVNGDGLPEVAPVFYAADDRLRLYWLSTPGTRHAANLAREPRVAVAIYPAVWDWTAIRGVQAEGEAMQVTGRDARQAALSLYRVKFDLPAQFDALIESAAVYAMSPRWVRWLDNSRGFGHKEEARIEG